MYSNGISLMRFIVVLSLLTGTLLAGACKPLPSQDYQWKLPKAFPLPLVPEDNPMSNAKVKLGKHLFYDPDLSSNQQTSCATCHQQAFAFAEASKTAKGTTGQIHRRNTQSLVNIAYNGNLTWAHSGLNSIEQQILIPMFSENPIELGITGHEERVLSRFAQGKYPKLFEQAFNTQEPSFDHIVKALASFVRTLVSFNSPFDRYAYHGDDNAMSNSAKRGMDLFFSEKFECFHCHGGFNFTQSSQHQNQRLDLRPFHNTGLYSEDEFGAYPSSDQGLIEITLAQKDMGRFRAPTLRNVSVSAPYMHDGSLASLEEVIDFYLKGGREKGVSSPLKSTFIKQVSSTEQDKQDLIEFLKSLRDDEFLNNLDYAAPSSAG
jgi:cytochrome c peroxidase